MFSQIIRTVSSVFDEKSGQFLPVFVAIFDEKLRKFPAVFVETETVFFFVLIKNIILSFSFFIPVKCFFSLNLTGA